MGKEEESNWEENHWMSLEKEEEEKSISLVQIVNG